LSFARVLVVGVVAAAAACGYVSPPSKSPQPDGGTSQGCRNSLDCTLGLVCDPAIATCVGCITAADCPANNDCTARQCVPFVPCKSSLECPASQVCDAAAGRCAACVTDADCADASKTCVADSCRTKCMSDRTCTPLGLLCDTSSGSCVRCLVSADCPSGQYCQANACVAALCTPGRTTCMLNAIASCNSVGDGYAGAAVPCGPKVCVAGASGAACVDAAADAGSGSGGSNGGSGGSNGGSGGSNGGSGGTGGGGGSTGSCGLTIDDMEAGTGFICQGNGRMGHWFAYNDGNARTTQTPPTTQLPARPEPVVPPRGTSNYAMHTSGTIVTDLAIACSLNGNNSDLTANAQAYDGSAYTGIAFYAKGTPQVLQVIIGTTDDVPTTYGGTCNGGISSCISSHVNITLDPTQWKAYQIPFSQFRLSANPNFNPARILTINFQDQYGDNPTTAADYWIDDLAFY